jgi:hypothetical protein
LALTQHWLGCVARCTQVAVIVDRCWAKQGAHGKGGNVARDGARAATIILQIKQNQE